jgi:hypothetical protein
MKQLAAARAVISIWTSNSIRSDWVRAEAGRAKNEGKLIPVKTPDVAYADIPLPFGEMHTENVASTDLIRAALVAQLAKPTAQPTAWVLLTTGFKYEIFTWVGIVGGALTLFSNVGAVLKLADWARLLVQHWKEWTHAFWQWAFGWLGIHLRPEWMPILSFLLFGSLLTIGQAVQFKRTTKNQLISVRTDLSVDIKKHIITFLIYTLISIIGWGGVVVILDLYQHLDKWTLLVLIPIVFVFPLVILVMRDRLNAGVSICLTMIFWIVITFNPTSEPVNPTSQSDFLLAAFGVIWVLPMILLSVAPAKAVSRRLIFLALGLLLLIALNELSKLGLDVSAPKPHV